MPLDVNQLIRSRNAFTDALRGKGGSAFTRAILDNRRQKATQSTRVGETGRERPISGLRRNGGQRATERFNPFTSTIEPVEDVSGDFEAPTIGEFVDDGTIPMEAFEAPETTDDVNPRSPSRTPVVLDLPQPSDDGIQTDLFGTPTPSGGSQESNPETQSVAAFSDSQAGAFAFDREARVDSAGNPTLYSPPSADANSLEVSGFGNKTNPKEFRILRGLLAKGQGAEAKRRAQGFLAKRGAPFTKDLTNPNIASVVTGAVHHRGEGGIKEIFNAFGAQDAKQIEEAFAADPQGAASKWVDARLRQEKIHEGRQWVQQGRPGSLAEFRARRQRQFGKGLRNRYKLEIKEILGG